MNKLMIIGGVSVDLMGQATASLRSQDSNPGTVTLSFGGVGRNIAENIARLKSAVTLISVFGEDVLGHLCFDACQEAGINVTHAVFAPQPTSAYLAILDQSGDMALAISDNSILSHLKYETIEPQLVEMTEEDVLVLESNLSEDLIATILTQKHCIIACDPISTRKAEKFRSHLHQIDIFKPNVLEAEIYVGYQLKSDADFLKALHYFRSKGISEIIISAAEKGIYASMNNDYFHLQSVIITPQNVTGAGDAFMGSYLVFRQSEPFQKSLELAYATAILTLQSKATVADLSLDQIKQTHQQLRFVRKNLC